jgi:hypothetical protein
MLYIIGFLTFFFIVVLRQTLHKAHQQNDTAEDHFKLKYELKNKIAETLTEFDYDQQ